ncbi:MAG: hypothetical protein Q7K55_05990 [Candidatus Levybacteria bacterium]|nr:hypothetical protein [Candidatus Levybacteria bacterium]
MSRSEINIGNYSFSLPEVVREQLAMSLPTTKAEAKFMLAVAIIGTIEYYLLAGLPQQADTMAGTIFIGGASFAKSKLQQKFKKDRNKNPS